MGRAGGGWGQGGDRPDRHTWTRTWSDRFRIQSMVTGPALSPIFWDCFGTHNSPALPSKCWGYWCVPLCQNSFKLCGLWAKWLSSSTLGSVTKITRIIPSPLFCRLSEIMLSTEVGTIHLSIHLRLRPTTAIPGIVPLSSLHLWLFSALCPTSHQYLHF